MVFLKLGQDHAISSVFIHRRYRFWNFDLAGCGAETVPSDSAIPVVMLRTLSRPTTLHDQFGLSWFVRKLPWFFRNPRKTVASFIDFALDASRILKHARRVSNYFCAGEALPPLSSEHEAGRLKAVLLCILSGSAGIAYVDHWIIVNHCESLLSNPCQRMPLNIPCEMALTTKKEVTRKARVCCGVGVLPECFRDFEFDSFGVRIFLAVLDKW